MKIRAVAFNNRKRLFDVRIGASKLAFPYCKSDPAPISEDLVGRVSVDDELGQEAFTYELVSGRTGTVHAEQVLEYNQDPALLRNQLLYRLTLEAQRRVEESPLAKREIARRLNTSATQLYRLLDQTNDAKSVDQILVLLRILDCDVDVIVRRRTA